jgi:SAM-dependent methyltransferase
VVNAPGSRDWAGRANRLAADALAQDDPTGWFERLYADADSGAVSMPWDRVGPRDLLNEWTLRTGPPEPGDQRAIVVGCSLGEDAEHLARLGFDTVAFDIAPTAIRLARDRHPDTAVQYEVADVLSPPAGWRRAFDLVVEIHTVQALPDPPRPEAIANIADLVAPGGTLLVVAARRADDDPEPDGPPWPLTRTEIESFAAAGLAIGVIEAVTDPVDASHRRWLAEFVRASS